MKRESVGGEQQVTRRNSIEQRAHGLDSSVDFVVHNSAPLIRLTFNHSLLFLIILDNFFFSCFVWHFLSSAHTRHLLQLHHHRRSVARLEIVLFTHRKRLHCSTSSTLPTFIYNIVIDVVYALLHIGFVFLLLPSLQLEIHSLDSLNAPSVCPFNYTIIISVRMRTEAELEASTESFSFLLLWEGGNGKLIFFLLSFFSSSSCFGWINFLLILLVWAYWRRRRKCVYF